jgi:putative PIG3 family NAD(P)H quinone oxidoreductase
MRAVLITRPGDPEVLALRDLPDPEPGPEDLLIRVRASALNRADLLQRRGRYPAPAGAPADIPGLEFAGEVRHCGPLAHGFRRGDRVMGILGGGGHAEQVALHHRLCLRIPPSLSWERAAAIPEAFLTAYDAMFAQGRLAAGETVLVQAAASGVGTAALQLGRVAGARVIGLCRTRRKREQLEEAGFKPVFDPAEKNVADRILHAAGNDGVDLVLDMVGASAWPLHARVLRERGRIVVIGLLGGARGEIDLALLMARRATLTGSVLRSRPLEERIALVQRFGRRILPLLAAGRVRPWVDRAYPMRDIAVAHAVMERNENLGKIVLMMDGE